MKRNVKNDAKKPSEGLGIPRFLDEVLNRKDLREKLVKSRNGRPLYSNEKEATMLKDVGEKFKRLFRKRS